MPKKSKILFIAGQLGWDEKQNFQSKELIPQFELALLNVLTVLKAADGKPEDICRLSCYCKDRNAYLRGREQINLIIDKLLKGHTPAFSIRFIVDLLGKFSQIEIEATAVITTIDNL
ncbi:MAG: RidA family protein [Proteobacteria bacterium]|nr:RidA family protein [Pseudomonadota bacterium]